VFFSDQNLYRHGGIKRIYGNHFAVKSPGFGPVFFKEEPNKKLFG